MARVLFFCTSSFPYGTGETFIENEIPFLSQAFDLIVIVSNDTISPQTRTIPQNVVCQRISYELPKFQKFLSIFGIFSKLFWQEMRIITKEYRKSITGIQIKTAIQTLRKASYIGNYMSTIIQNYSSESDSRFVYSYWTNDMAFVNTKICQKLSVQSVFSRAHGWDVYFEVNDAHYLPFRKYILTKSNGIFFISRRGYDYYAELFPLLVQKMRVSYLGVIGYFQIKTTRPNVCRIVSCSNVISIKQIDLIIHALTQIREYQIEWIHFGDGELFQQIQKLTHELLDKKTNISFSFAGRVSNTEVMNYYKNNYVDCLINVSLSEGIPVSMMEAMSFGIPVIGTNVGGVSEIIEHETNGFLLSPTPSKEEVAAAIERFCSLTHDEVQTMRNNAYNTWDTKFNAQKNYKEFIRLIQSL
jgi:glycosyltransferase involved in cell wall biosynthesis